MGVAAAAVIFVGALLFIVGGGELPVTAVAVVALVLGAVLAAIDQMRHV